jgi:Flp pilus assembly protein TadG
MLATIRHRLSAFPAARCGTAAVEFALVSPAFLVLLFGMIAYGIYIGASHSVQQISADAARAALAGLTQSERQSLAEAFVARNAARYPFIDRNALAVSAQDSADDGSQFVVRISYNASGLPIWNLFEGVKLPGQMITRTATIRVGGL